MASAPLAVQNAVLAQSHSLEPGAVSVMGRFFDALELRGEAHDNPSTAVFTDAAKSESTLATLLRSLETYAPQICTAAGRDLRRDYYRARAEAQTQDRPNEGAVISETAPSKWPAAWRAKYVGIYHAPNLRPATKKRHIASISRCADLLLVAGADATLDYLTGYLLVQELRKRGIKHKTIAGYLGGLLALEKYSEADGVTVASLNSLIQQHLTDAKFEDKEKLPRLQTIMSQGGFAFIAETAGQLRSAAAARAGWTSQKQRLQQMVALLAVHMNKPARTSDVARWVIGVNLIRHPSGLWELVWEQQKTGVETEAGLLWEEVSEILDELILGGRPDRSIHQRYDTLQGANWLTLEDRCLASKLPSQLIKEAIGIPSHDLRTLAADYLRLHDPETAPNTIRTHLGHSTFEAGKEYSILCKNDVADQTWKDIRETVKAKP